MWAPSARFLFFFTGQLVGRLLLLLFYTDRPFFRLTALVVFSLAIMLSCFYTWYVADIPTPPVGSIEKRRYFFPLMSAEMNLQV